MGPHERWYVAQTLPYREKSSSAQLNLQGFRTFLPLCVKTVRHARKFRTVHAPLFPRYVFVTLDLTRDRWRSVNGTFGVASLIMGNELPIPVPAGIVEQLSESCAGDGLLKPLAALQKGAQARVISGPFADLIGTLEQVDDLRRVKILLDLMGGKVFVTLRADSLAPAA